MKPKLSRLAQACCAGPSAPLLEALIVVKGVDAWLAVDATKLGRIRVDEEPAELSAGEAWALMPVESGPLSRAKRLVLVLDDAGDIEPIALDKDGALIRPVFTAAQRGRIIEMARAASTRH